MYQNWLCIETQQVGSTILSQGSKLVQNLRKDLIPYCCPPTKYKFVIRKNMDKAKKQVPISQATLRSSFILVRAPTSFKQNGKNIG